MLCARLGLTALLLPLVRHIGIFVLLLIKLVVIFLIDHCPGFVW
jgi:hypothetical protein